MKWTKNKTEEFKNNLIDKGYFVKITGEGYSYAQNVALLGFTISDSNDVEYGALISYINPEYDPINKTEIKINHHNEIYPKGYAWVKETIEENKLRMDIQKIIDELQ